MGLFDKSLKILLLTFVFASAKAQDLEYLKKNQNWMLSNNPNAIQYTNVDRISTAEFYAQKSKGDFRNYFETNDGFVAGLRTESYYKQNDKLYFYGKVDFHTFSGKNMGGSVFMNPYLNSFDIQEFSETNAGKKKSEAYILAGGVSYKANSKLNLGAKLDYQAANYTKLKDLRHVNKLLHLNLNLGAQYAINPKNQLGLNYVYDRRIESVGFKVYGNTDTQYLSLISFGSFWGRKELHSESGYTSANTPMVNHNHEIFVQYNTILNKKSEWLIEGNFGKRNGYFGTKGTRDIMYTKHKGQNFGFNSVFSLKENRKMQQFQLGLEKTNLSNHENVFRKETTQGGVSTIVYYGSNEVLDQNLLKANARYTAFLNIDKNVPEWILSTNIDFNNRDQISTLYPFFRKTNFNYYSLSANAKKNKRLNSTILSFGLATKYQKGSGTPFKDGVYSSGNNAFAPASLNDLLLQEFQYLTSSQIYIKPEIGFEKPLEKAQSLYFNLSIEHKKALQYLKGNFTNLEFVLGFKF